MASGVDVALEEIFGDAKVNLKKTGSGLLFDAVLMRCYDPPYSYASSNTKGERGITSTLE